MVVAGSPAVFESKNSSDSVSKTKKKTEVNSYVHSKIHLVDLAGDA